MRQQKEKEVVRKPPKFAPKEWPDQEVSPHKYPPLKNQSHFAGRSIDRRSNYFFFSFGPCTARFLFFFW
ncbi:hypothetical protein, partial [uncultured Oscillibacter sp.]